MDSSADRDPDFRDLLLDDLRAQIIGAADEPPDFLRRIAVHEAAHAVTAAIIPVGRVIYVKLASRGRSAGHTKLKYPNDDLTVLVDVENRVVSILSAGVAERLFLGAASIGSGGNDNSDLGVATAWRSGWCSNTLLPEPGQIDSFEGTDYR
jgi:cell division protease FtsH